MWLLGEWKRMTSYLRAPRLLCALATASALCVPLATPAAADTAPTVTIDSPTAAVPAGTVVLQGAVNAGSPTDTTTVLYVVDASGSTMTSAPSCGDPNLDAATNVLDCEIGAVKTLNTQLAGASGRLVTGLEAFTNTAQVASLQTQAEGPLTFASPGYTGGLAETRLNTVADGVRLSHIKEFIDTDLVGHGTDFKAAIDTAAAALATAPAGPKFIMFLSDGGKHNATAPDLTKLQGIQLRSFDLGGSTCSALMISIATNGDCQAVPDASTLSAQLTGSQPPSIQSVTVTINGKSLAANVNTVGGWSASFVLGQGSYGATVTAGFSSGASATATRTITVGAAPAGTVAPPPGSVAPGAGTLLASKVRVNRPSSSRHRLPAHVTGAVGRFASTLIPTHALNGATVALQGRSRVGGTWVTVAKAKVAKGDYSLTWKPKSTVHDLQVKLVSFGGFSSSTAPVPVSAISACKLHTRGTHRTLTCHTIAKAGTKAQVLSHGHVLAHTKVSKGLVTVSLNRKFAGTVLKVFASKAHPFSLHL
jgi:hypothetical protein